MLTVRDISFSYNDTPNLNSISFSLTKGKNLALIGESGCGKSTLLKLIYGLYDLDEGQIFWNDIEVLGPKFHLIPGMPFMKYLAQDFDLMPFITVAENVGKYLSNFYPEEKKARIVELLEIVNSYFRGSHYLMEAKYGNRILFFENDAILENGEVVCLRKV